ncbi:putative transmembrane protein [Toxoplasma gondii GAB2-2007-GAL-DOM2]|uniref:Putative transmembrane protein n=2 Tax=Toxoplasma gondii TaxID=5811 RepID=V4YPP7_TOXGV|nr:putative transmembrane protein [Toxoplasma gondii VEG]KFG35745.1 putative transmembrane protein [Toxoplasma gondii GAB2-2007-GAL-DOM2]CEL72169.1 TPA: hypothetical protein BN1205_056240 [Toxoplasma gondii VEG]
MQLPSAGKNSQGCPPSSLHFLSPITRLHCLCLVACAAPLLWEPGGCSESPAPTIATSSPELDLLPDLPPTLPLHEGTTLGLERDVKESARKPLSRVQAREETSLEIGARSVKLDALEEYRGRTTGSLLPFSGMAAGSSPLDFSSQQRRSVSKLFKHLFRLLAALVIISSSIFLTRESESLWGISGGVFLLLLGIGKSLSAVAKIAKLGFRMARAASAQRRVSVLAIKKTEEESKRIFRRLPRIKRGSR